MTIAADIHFGFAFLVALCALVFSWNTMGRRVMNVVIGLQILAGLALAGIIGMQHAPLPAGLLWHIVVALVALAAYVVARRAGERPGSGTVALAFSLLGLICVGLALYLGLHMAGLA